MMNKSLYEVYQKAVSVDFQRGFARHLKRRLIRAVILQENTESGRFALKQGHVQNKYLKEVLLSRYEEFFNHIKSFHRELTDMEVRNVSDNEKPMLDYVLLRSVLNEKVSPQMSRESAIKLAMYDYYLTLSTQKLNRNAGDFFYFLTGKHAQALKEHLFSGLNETSQLVSIYLLAN
ncbi:MAG: hypothetical protein MK008_06300 [Bdellovibrionales bacterium]|nr:hypothetical protein [Bdellovibrionales bacterium]